MFQRLFNIDDIDIVVRVGSAGDRSASLCRQHPFPTHPSAAWFDPNATTVASSATGILAHLPKSSNGNQPPWQQNNEDKYGHDYSNITGSTATDLANGGVLTNTSSLAGGNCAERGSESAINCTTSTDGGNSNNNGTNCNQSSRLPFSAFPTPPKDDNEVTGLSVNSNTGSNHNLNLMSQQNLTPTASEHSSSSTTPRDHDLNSGRHSNQPLSHQQQQHQYSNQSSPQHHQTQQIHSINSQSTNSLTKLSHGMESTLRSISGTAAGILPYAHHHYIGPGAGDYVGGNTNFQSQQAMFAASSSAASAYLSKTKCKTRSCTGGNFSSAFEQILHLLFLRSVK